MAKQNILSRSKIQKAQKAIDAGNLPDAINLLEQICKKNPKDASSWLLLGSVHGRMNNLNGVANCANQVLEIDPSNPTALCYLGNINTATGKYDEAIDYFTRSLKKEPKNIATLNNLSILYIQQNRLDEATSLLNVVIKSKPDHIEALKNLGKISTDQGNFELAIQCYSQVDKLQPNNIETLFILARNLHNINAIDESKNLFKKCLDLTDKTTEIYISLSEIELQENNYSNAEDFLTKALETDPTSITARTRQANLWYRQGKTDQAFERITQLINEGNITSGVLVVYSLICKHFNKCDEVIDLIKTLLIDDDKANIQDKMPQHERVSLQYRLGNIINAKGQYSEAFNCFKDANDSILVNYNAEAQTQYINDIIKQYSIDNLSIIQHSDNSSTQPVFIIGMPRSGTSLVEQIIDSHPDVFGGGEMNSISNIAHKRIPQKINQKPYPAYATELSKEILNEMSQEYLDGINKISNNAYHVTDKMPQNFLQLGLINQLFPNAKIIHCKRHPLDVIVSIYFQYFSKLHSYSFNLENIAHYYSEYERLMNHWNNNLQSPMLEVNYSELVDDFENKCHEIIDFIGLEWNEQCLNFHESERTVVTASFDQVRSPIYSSSINRWKHYEEFLQPLKESFPDLWH